MKVLENAWYFRNALVRANYNDLKNGIHATTEFLERFLKNLLLDKKNELHNRAMHIRKIFGEYKKSNIEAEESDIGAKEPDIEPEKPYIEAVFTKKTISHAQNLFNHFGHEKLFGRSSVKDVLGLKDSAASELLSKLLRADIIEPVSGYGKGKYKFRKDTWFL